MKKLKIKQNDFRILDTQVKMALDHFESDEDFIKMCIDIYNHNKNNSKYKHLYK